MQCSVRKFYIWARAVNKLDDIPLKVAKIGVAADAADKRIRQLNGTKMPIRVELESAWTFQNSPLEDAYIAEQAAHSLLSSKQVSGEWFEDQNEELADNLGRFVSYLGGAPLLSNTDPDSLEEFHVVASKQQHALDKMKTVFEPISDELKNLEIRWEYMTWKVGMTTPFGRLNISVRNSHELYIVLKDKSIKIDQLNAITAPLVFKNGMTPGHFLTSGVDVHQLIVALSSIPSDISSELK